ncbi:MAG TPA: pyridoxamine 5'-phosphate oxidase family protein [Chloroflexota bacterium]|nr:pyridoxamine 5'-phosphate oxidase family protein [Chloroflexota bacterium]
MTDLERTFLQENRIGRVSTLSAEGFPHVTPVLLQLDGEAVQFETDGSSAKMRNIRGNPRIGILVDGERKRGVLLQGNAEIARDAHGKDQALIRLRPQRVISWRMG